jgi:hypothetical protein
LITNHSGKQVIAALVVMTFADKTPAVTKRLFTHTADQLPDGGSELVGEYSRRIPHSFVVGVKVNAVIFADGEFRGEDSYQDAKGATLPANFQSNMEQAMQSMRKVWQMAKAGDWAGVKTEADGVGDGNLYAARLLFERDRPGAGAAKAVSLLAHWGLLPASTWKGGLLNRLQFVRMFSTR